ncbi:MAG: hypothetical protein SFW36_17190 [Leptolyngbyaceae cyanobacterium bins.59]|nr:hypothetical protein [Leptolyngbyaceae cyanobacterium bins.59]
MFGWLALIAYVGGTVLFWNGFRKTFLTQTLSNRLLFSVSWPVWLVSKAGRQHLGRALKGS